MMRMQSLAGAWQFRQAGTKEIKRPNEVKND